MSSPSSPRSQPSSTSVQRPLSTSATLTVPSPQKTGTEKAASSPAVATATPDTPQQTSATSTALSPQNTGTEKETETSLEEYLEWTLKVLGFAAACIFGAWAPLSYKATLDGNSGNDAAQSQASVAASQQSIAANQQSVAASQQSVALDAINSRVGAIGQLWLYDFCITQTVRPHVF